MGDYVASLAAPDLMTRFRDDRWPAVFESQAKEDRPLFSTPIETETTSWNVSVTRDSLLDRMSTLSHLALLEGKERDEFEEKVDQILEGDVVKDEKGQFEAHGVTFFAWSTGL
jgi:hypothetical protein